MRINAIRRMTVSIATAITILTAKPSLGETLSPAAYLGKWHQPAGASGCGGKDAYEATFNLTSFDKDRFVGSFQISCVNAAGNFKTDGTAPSALIDSEGSLLVTFRAGRYALRRSGDLLIGEFQTSGGMIFKLGMRPE